GGGALEVGGGGTGGGDAALHGRVGGPAALARRPRRQLLAVVHTGRLAGIRRHDRLDARAGADQDADDVRQVVLALIVVRAHPVERGPQPSRGEAVDRGVDLGDLLLGGGRVALLDDAPDGPTRPHDAPVPGGLR